MGARVAAARRGSSRSTSAAGCVPGSVADGALPSQRRASSRARLRKVSALRCRENAETHPGLNLERRRPRAISTRLRGLRRPDDRSAGAARCGCGVARNPQAHLSASRSVSRCARGRRHVTTAPRRAAAEARTRETCKRQRERQSTRRAAGERPRNGYGVVHPGGSRARALHPRLEVEPGVTGKKEFPLYLIEDIPQSRRAHHPTKKLAHAGPTVQTSSSARTSSVDRAVDIYTATPGHRHRQVGRRGGRAPSVRRGAIARRGESSTINIERDQASRAGRETRRPVDRRGGLAGPACPFRRAMKAPPRLRHPSRGGGIAGPRSCGGRLGGAG